MSNDPDYIRMIHTARWLRLRRLRLSEQPLCPVCRAAGRTRPATEVHHVRPVEAARTLGEKERLMFDPHNLRPLCRSCHVAAHQAMGKGTKATAAERKRAEAEAFRRRFLGKG